MINRPNLWTALGTAAASLTGRGVSAHWLSQLTRESVTALLTCRTALANMRAVQDGEVGPTACGPYIRVTI